MKRARELKKAVSTANKKPSKVTKGKENNKKLEVESTTKVDSNVRVKRHSLEANGKIKVELQL